MKRNQSNSKALTLGLTLGIAATLAFSGMAIAAQQSSWHGAHVSMNKEEIMNVQRKLNEKGYNAGSVDGMFGKKTADAIRKFQKDNNEPVTGKLDAQTEQALGVEAAGAVNKNESSNESNQPGEAAPEAQASEQPGQVAPQSQSGEQSGQNQNQNAPSDTNQGE